MPLSHKVLSSCDSKFLKSRSRASALKSSSIGGPHGETMLLLLVIVWVEVRVLLKNKQQNFELKHITVNISAIMKTKKEMSEKFLLSTYSASGLKSATQKVWSCWEEPPTSMLASLSSLNKDTTCGIPDTFRMSGQSIVKKSAQTKTLWQNFHLILEGKTYFQDEENTSSQLDTQCQTSLMSTGTQCTRQPCSTHCGRS